MARSFKALEEPISENGDVFKLLFRNHKTVHASRLLFKWMLDRGGYATPFRLSQFAWKLQRGVAEKGFTYRRSSLYRTVLWRLLDFGFVNQQQIYDKETGARRGEIFNLKWTDIDLVNRTVRITPENRGYSAYQRSSQPC